MKKILIIIIAFAATTAAKAQSKPRNNIGFSLGWQNFTFLDKHSSPLQYSTNSLFPNAGLFYNKQTDGSLLNIHVSASKGTINPSRYGVRSYKAVWSPKDSFQYSLASQFIHVNMEASYLRNVTSLSSQKTAYWVGGTFNEAAYYGDDIASSDWLLNVADVAPAFQFQYQPFTKHSIHVRFDLSVLGAITRPIYALFPKSGKDKNVAAYFKQGTQVASLNKFQKVNFQLNYNYQLTRHFAAGAEYRLRWIHYTDPKDIRALDKHFDIRLSYTY